MLSMKVSGIKNRKTKFVEGQKLRNEKTKSKKREDKIYRKKNPKILHLLPYISPSLTQHSSTFIKI